LANCRIPAQVISEGRRFTVSRPSAIVTRKEMRMGKILVLRGSTTGSTAAMARHAADHAATVPGIAVRLRAVEEASIHHSLLDTTDGGEA
jgi:hypothetical protein